MSLEPDFPELTGINGAGRGPGRSASSAGITMYVGMILDDVHGKPWRMYRMGEWEPFVVTDYVRDQIQRMTGQDERRAFDEVAA